MFKCGPKYWANKYAQSGNDVYFYEMHYRASNEAWPPWMGVIHGAEIQFVFGWPFNRTKNFNDDDRKFSEHIMNYWGNFAKTG